LLQPAPRGKLIIVFRAGRGFVVANGILVVVKAILVIWLIRIIRLVAQNFQVIGLAVVGLFQAIRPVFMAVSAIVSSRSTW
jgi:hypothetical protein